MKIFDYSIKIKVALSGVLVILIVFVILVARYNNSYSNDLERVTQAKELASGLERYFDKNNSYPEVKAIDLKDIKIITENGVNQTGNYLHFSAPKKVMDITLVSTNNRYIIQFDLDNAWEVWAIDSNKGGICRISNNLEMICQSK